MVHQRNIDELLKKHEAVMKEKEQLHQVNLEKLKKYYKKKYEEKVQQELGARSGSGSCTPVEVCVCMCSYVCIRYVFKI